MDGKDSQAKQKQNSFQYYRTRFFSNEVLELLTKDDFMNLVHIAHYAGTGVATAIKAAFCLGYHAGKGKVAE